MPNAPDTDDLEEEAADDAFAALLREVAEAPRLPAALMRTITFDGPEGPRPSVIAQLQTLPRIGDIIDDRYLIQTELGRGGMGVVFGARNVRTQSDVALKWMLPRALTRTASERHEGVERFVREARAVSRVDHPNVVRVLDVGGDPGAPYLVMERLEGESLRDRLARNLLSWDEALAIVLPVMQGVSAAHKAGVVHRDLKPDNIFLCRDVVKVLDFGVSRIGGGEAYTTLTRTGTMLGTPAYMPLEQLRGSRDVDERTDVYALGVILFEALSGRLPFEAQTAADQAVLLATRGPEKLAELVPVLRGPRADAVMKALSRDPEDRYPSVEAMAHALENAPQTTSGARARWLWMLGAAAAVALAFALWGLSEPSDVGTPDAPSTLSADAPAVITQPAPLTAPRPTATDTPQAIEPASAPALEAAPTEPSAPMRGRKRGSLPLRARAAVPATGVAPTALSVDQFKAGDSTFSPMPTALDETQTKPNAAQMKHDEF